MSDIGFTLGDFGLV